VGEGGHGTSYRYNYRLPGDNYTGSNKLADTSSKNEHIGLPAEINEHIRAQINENIPARINVNMPAQTNEYN